MSQLRVHNMSISIDGFVAGPDQCLETPLGVGGEDLHHWMFATAGAQRMIDGEGGSTGLDDDMFAAGIEGIGATIMGRNMFGPIRGEWPDDDWKGWWGPNPPYHHATFVLTHHARDPLVMEGGTTFHFVTDGIESALAQAIDAADGQDIRLGGGASVVRQYLRAGLVDRMHLAFVPVLLGGGERIFDDADGTAAAIAEGYECTSLTPGDTDAVHAVFTRR